MTFHCGASTLPTGAMYTSILYSVMSPRQVCVVSVQLPSDAAAYFLIST